MPWLEERLQKGVLLYALRVANQGKLNLLQSPRETPNLVFSIYFGTTWLILENAMGLCSNSILHDQGCVVSEQECIMQKQCIMQKAIQSCLRERGSLGNISIWQLFSVV